MSFAWKTLVVGLDGGQHNSQSPQEEDREAWLRQEGDTVIRFWNHEVLKQMETVKNVIWSTLSAPPPESSAEAGEE
jgi:very-short-patch-repair endonuclease